MIETVTDQLDVLLLLALPASGKSEVRRYLDHLDPERARGDMALGPTAQLDDFPYVHLMRRISQELRALGEDPLFFATDEASWREPLDWLTLVHLINDDFAQIDTDAELKLEVFGEIRVTSTQLVLYRTCASQRIGDGAEVGQHRIAGIVDDIAVVLGDVFAYELQVVTQTPMSAFLIQTGEPAVACYICVEYGRKLACEFVDAHGLRRDRTHRVP